MISFIEFWIQGAEGSRTIELKEGTVTDVTIEVTAEDGRTVKNYVIHAKRLSAKDASLSDLKVDVDELQPCFDPNIFEYSCELLC